MSESEIETHNQMVVKIAKLELNNAELQARNIQLETERKEVCDALNEAASFGGFDGYDEDSNLLRNVISHFNRLQDYASQRIEELELNYEKDKRRLDWLGVDRNELDKAIEAEADRYDETR